MRDPIHLLVVLAVCGFLAYLFDLLVPLPPRFRKAFFAVCGFLAFLYVLQAFGVIGKIFGR